MAHRNENHAEADAWPAASGMHAPFFDAPEFLAGGWFIGINRFRTLADENRAIAKVVNQRRRERFSKITVGLRLPFRGEILKINGTIGFPKCFAGSLVE